MRYITAILIVASLIVVGSAAASLPAPGSGTIAVAAGSDLSFQGIVSFDTSYAGHLKNPRVEVLCYQDGSLVYGEAGDADQSFVLGGGGSIWVYGPDGVPGGGDGGGPADCVANLFYWKSGNHEWNGSGQQEYVLLGSVSFAATG